MKCFGCTVILTLLLLAATVYPYSLRYVAGKDDAALKWRDARIELRVSRSLLANVPDIRDREETLSAIRRAAGLWEEAAAVEFRIGITEIESVSPPGKTGDGVSVITIAQTPENLLLFSGKNSSSAAFTRVFYDSRGHISEADIVLNPYFLVSTKGLAGSFDLEATVTHELGHVLGLGHSAIFSAVMAEETGRNGIYGIPEAPEGRLASDDIAGARALYGVPKNVLNCCSSIRITSGRGAAKNYRVWAVESDSGRIVASADSNSSGRAELEGLDSGAYEVFGKDLETEPSAAYRLGLVTAGARGETELMFAVDQQKSGFELSNVGFNGQLSTVAVPLNPGSTFRIYVGGANLSGDLSYFIRSPYFSVDKATVERIGGDGPSSVVSFLVEVGEDAPFGDYPIVVTDKQGGQQWLLGAVTVGDLKNPWPVLQF